jgi:hypothetical protein
MSSDITMVELSRLESLPFSLRRLRLAEDCARCGRLLVHYVHPDHGHDVTGHTWGTRFASTAGTLPWQPGVEDRCAMTGQSVVRSRIWSPNPISPRTPDHDWPTGVD